MSDSNLDTKGTGTEESVGSDAGDASITDILTKPLAQAYIKAIAVLYALVGAGLGLLVIAINVVDEPILEEEYTFEVVSHVLETMPITGSPYIATVLAVLVGGHLGLRMSADDRETIVAGATGVFAGTILLWILSAFLAASQIDDVSVSAGGLLLNAIVLGVFIGGITAGTVYIVRNLVPDGRDAAA